MEPLSREQVHEAVACLNDNVALASTPLAEQVPEVRALGGVDARANALRAIILQAIEVLRPPHRLPFGSLASRSYDVLSLRYVGGKTVTDVCDEFSLGRRQIHRDLMQAEEKLTRILQARLDSVSQDQKAQLAGELSAFAPDPSRVQLRAAVQATLALLRPLADQFGVRLACDPGTDPLPVLADMAALRQVLAQLLSAAIQATAGKQVSVALQEQGDDAVAVITFQAASSGLPMPRLLGAQQIAASQRMACELAVDRPEQAQITLRLSRASPVRVLVVEDNPSAVELYRRYLPPEDWEVHVVCDPRATVETAKSLGAEVIVLDIMLPKVDGWTLLGQLASGAETSRIPVVVCSVVDDPDLARALGARAYLTKPVSQDSLRDALRQCLPPPRLRR
ncbi:MAG: ATP-binding response regulator [Anaerolineae bacterium]